MTVKRDGAVTRERLSIRFMLVGLVSPRRPGIIGVTNHATPRCASEGGKKGTKVEPSHVFSPFARFVYCLPTSALCCCGSCCSWHRQLEEILAHMRDGEMHNTVFITADGKLTRTRLQVLVYTVTPRKLHGSSELSIVLSIFPVIVRNPFTFG